MISNFQIEKRINFVIDILKNYKKVSTYAEVSIIYNEILEKNRRNPQKPGFVFDDFPTEEHYEDMILTQSYHGFCPICEKPISGTPINREIFVPTKTYHAIISCSHCSFRYTAENVITEALKEKILAEAATHKKNLPSIEDLFE